LAVVLAIIAVVTAITLPQLQNVNQNTEARNEAHRFVQMMREAAELARSTRQVICVVAESPTQFSVRGATGANGRCDDTTPTNNTLLNGPLSFPTVSNVRASHIAPPAPLLVRDTSVVPRLLWAETAFGQPGGVLGVDVDLNFGIPAGNTGERTPLLEVTATFGGSVNLVITHYTSGTLDVQGL
jgi:type II secretory pathway pseudopilin PulG